MAYIYNIPMATDALSVSQGQILGNFNALGAIGGNGMNSSAGIASVGFNWLFMATQGAIPPTGSSFASGNVALYSAANPTTSQNELYINKLNQATVVQIPATASSLSIVSAPAAGTAGWAYLPTGHLVKWGNSATSSSTLGSSRFNPDTISGGPNFTQVLNVSLTQNASISSLMGVQWLVFRDYSKPYVYIDGFIGTTCSSGISFYYWIIGY
jgi:hypothetical protein